MPNRPGYYTAAFAKLRKRYGGVCQHERCNAMLGLEFAHVVTTAVNGRGRGMPQRLHDIRRHPNRYRLLCRPHHMEFDRTEGPKLPDEVPF